MFVQGLFNHSAELVAGLISRLIFSRWARDYEEHHGACEDSYAARLGPLHLEVSQCFVLDHDDASISIRLPIYAAPAPRGKLRLGYVICLGEDELRRPGFYAYLQKPLPRLQSGQAVFGSDEGFPF